MASKVYGIIIELKGDFRIDELKYSANLTISDAKKIYRKLQKLSGLDKGEITVFNDDCSVKCWYTLDGTKFLKKEW